MKQAKSGYWRRAVNWGGVANPLLKALAVTACVSLVFCLGTALAAIMMEWGSVAKGRLYRSRGDIEYLVEAAEHYRHEYGHYPSSLDELAHPILGSGHTELLAKVPLSPWRTSYHYQVDSAPTGDHLKIWTMVDRRTQRDYGVVVVSNEGGWPAFMAEKRKDGPSLSSD